MDCSFECSAMLLGSLLKQLRTTGLEDLRACRPYENYSVNGLIATVSNFETPPRSSYSHTRSDWYNCTLENKIQPAMDELRGALKGFKLADYKDDDDVSCVV